MNRYVYTLFAVIMDAASVNAGILLSFLIRFGGNIPAKNFIPYQNLWVFITMILLFVFYFSGLYHRKRSSTPVNILDNGIKSISVGTLLLFVAFYSTRKNLGSFPTTVLAISWILNIILVSAWRIIINRFRKIAPKRLLVIGNGEEERKLLENIANDPSRGYQLVKVIDEGAKTEEIYGVPVIKSLRNIGNIIEKDAIDEIIIALPDSMHSKISDIVSQCHGLAVQIRVIPSLYEIFMSRTDGEEIDGLPLVEVMAPPIEGGNAVIKRLMDIIIAGIGLLLFMPVLLILAVLYKFGDKGPVFFTQERIGKDGKTFVLYKLRTMHTDAEKDTGPVLAGKDDKRVTKLGKLLRKFRIDEIPQLINVLKGDMSMVGPRPERSFFVEKFKKEIPGYVERLKIRPGISGMAQVNSRYDISAEGKLHYDLLYIRKQSLFMDLNIMMRTIWVMIARKGAQ